jgi:hypothetical protein
MTFRDFLITHRFQIMAALENLPLERITELADRDDPAEIGRVVLNAIEQSKHSVEQELKAIGARAVPVSILPDADFTVSDLPIMLRDQAD